MTNKLMTVRGSCIHFTQFTVSILLIVIQISTVKSYKPAPTAAIFKEPTIWLKGYRKEDGLYLIPVENDEYRFQHQVQNEFVSKNGSDYVISESVNAVDFRCQANYPVSWTLPFPKQIPSVFPGYTFTEEYRISELYSDTSEPINTRFETILITSLLSINFLSVNLTCKSAEIKEDIGSSIHIFVKGKNQIERQGQTLQVVAGEPDNISGPGQTVKAPPSPIIIPCRPATPDLKVSLEKEMVSRVYVDSTQKKIWRPLIRALEDKLSFDPKVGFTFQRSTLDNLIVGLYKCSVIDENGNAEEESKKFVFANVTMAAKDKPKPPTFSFQPRSILYGKAIANLEKRNFHPYSEFLCCTGDQSEPPKLFLKSCGTPLECDLAKDTILQDIFDEKSNVNNITEDYDLQDQAGTQKDCRKERLFSHNVIVVCQGKNVDFVDQLVTCFHPLAGGSVVNRTNRIIQSSMNQNLENHPTRVKEGVELDKSSAAILESDQNVSRKIIMIAGESVDIIKRHHKLFGRAGFGRRSNNGYGIPIRLTSADLEASAYGTGLVDGDFYSREHGRRVMEYPRDYYYEGEEVVFICIGLKFLYAKGAYLRLNWKNGTNSLLAEPSLEMNKKARSGRSAHVLLHLSGNAFLHVEPGNDYTIFERTTILANSGMRWVDCWMPKRNSRKWDKISKEIQVVPSVAPMFVENEQETIYWYVGDAGNVITCTLQQGRPSPSMTVARNGKNLTTIVVQAAVNNQTKPSHSTVGTVQTEIVDKNEDTIAIKIYFSVIEHDDHGSVFQCNATNVNATTTRTVRIFVEEKAHLTLLSITLSGIAVFVLVLVAWGVKHWYEKRHARSLQNNNGQSVNR